MTGDPSAPWLPLTAAQLGLYFAQQSQPANPAYTTAELIVFEQPVALHRLRDAVAAGYQDFEQLRTRFTTGIEEPAQQVMADRAVDMEEIRFCDDAEASAWLTETLSRPLDIGVGETTRTALLNVAGEHRWFHAAHHLVLDGFGFVQFARRVGAHYAGNAPELDAPGVADLVADDPGGLELDPHWAWRLDCFTGNTSLAGDTLPPGEQALRCARPLPPQIAADLAPAAHRLGTSWPELATAACAAYLARLMPPGTDSVRIGVPRQNRTLPGGGALVSARTVCTAVNVLPMELQARGCSVAELMERAGAASREIAAHPFTRHEVLARELRRRGGGALFGPQVNIIPFDPVLNFGQTRGRIRNLTAGPVDDMTWTLRGDARSRSLTLELDAHPGLYSHAEMAAHAERLLLWLNAFAAEAAQGGDRGVDELPLLGEQEREHVVHGLNRTRTAVVPQPLGETFRRQARATPEATALILGDQRWSYGRLLHEAEQLAGRLGPRPGAVAVALHRSLELYAAVHGIVLAGGSYVPVDPDTPPARIADMLADAEATTAIVAEPGAVDLPADVREVTLDGAGSHPMQAVTVDVDDDAYVLFTSGSTGRPKGVAITHRAICNRLEWMQDLLPLAAGDAVLHKTPITFDVSVWELFWPLRVGASVVIAEPGAHREPRQIAHLIDRHQVSTLHFVPSMLREFLADERAVGRARGRGLRNLVCSGETLTGDLVQQARERLGVPVVNLYGPTEAAVDVTAWRCETEMAGQAVPIGRPMWNTRVYVLDDQLQPLPLGCTGHLFLAGVQLASRYASRPDLTSEAFIADPFAVGERMYRTGDLARWRPDGVLLYEGRADSQVKIRGQRIEPGEIEEAMLRVPGVASAAVLAVPGPGGSPVLAGYYTAPAGGVATDELRRDLAGYLPEPMIPTHLVRLPALPLSASGKTDRRALAGLGLPSGRAPAEAPRDLLEQEVLRVFRAVLECPVGPADDFFTSGGHSLLGLRLVSELREALGDDAGAELDSLGFADLIAHPSPRALAARIRQRGAGGGDDLDPVLRLRRGETQSMPLFLLPPAGGLGWCYTGLLRHLPASRSVYALQTSPSRPEAADLDELAGQYLRLIEQTVGAAPVHLLGWSVGGMAAHATAALAAEAGREVGVVAMLDAYPGEQWRHLPEPTLAEALRGVLRMAGAEHLAAADEELTRERTVELLRADGSALALMPEDLLQASIRSVIHSARIVRSSQHRVLHHDVLFFRAAAPRAEDWLDASGWQQHLDGRLELHDIQTTHPGLVREPAIAEIGAVLARTLTDRAPAGALR